MIYQVRANLYFKTKAEAETLMNSLEVVHGMAITVRPGKPNKEAPTVELIKNYHDKDPSKPCVLLRSLPQRT